MPLVPDVKNVDISVKRAIQGLSKKLGYTGTPTLAQLTLSKTCEVAAGLNVLRVTGLQTDDTAMTGTLRGAYIDVSNGSTVATGTIRGMELKARTEAPGDTGNNVAVLEGLSISADSKGHSVTTMRAAEFILDGKTSGTIDEAVGLRIANNLQVDKATLSYGLQIYRDSFDYTYDIVLSLGGHITGDSYVNQDLRTTATPTFDDLTISTPVNIYALSHDSFADFVANEHIDHTTITLTAGSGIAGGGTIAANRTFDLDINSLAVATIAAGDFVPFWDITAIATNKKITFANFEAILNHDSLTGFAANEHYLQSTITEVGTIATGIWQATDVGIAYGGTGQSTAQLAINALTAVSGATNEHVLTKDTATGNAVFKAAAGGGTDTAGQGKVSVYLNASQTINGESGNYVIVGFDTEDFDVDGDFNTTTHQYTAPATGKYLICVGIGFNALTDGCPILISFYNVTDSTYIIFYHSYGQGTGYDYYSRSVVLTLTSGKVYDVRVRVTDAAYTVLGTQPYSHLSISKMD